MGIHFKAKLNLNLIDFNTIVEKTMPPDRCIVLMSFVQQHHYSSFWVNVYCHFRKQKHVIKYSCIFIEVASKQLLNMKGEKMRTELDRDRAGVRKKEKAIFYFLNSIWFAI